MESFANLAAIVVNRKNVRNSQDVCKSPKEAPKFEWLHKYRKASKGQGGVKQTLAPLGTTHTKISQHKKTSKPAVLFVSLSPNEIAGNTKKAQD
ncbi:hypothetical protein J4Q44_G00017520 [Coregonus suidteri]|uniref:Uncharacterized protein n=1 Tax=Coregonus suidteri TaxID=861788 RepID=A0AAN8RFV1_9TELE